MKKLLIICTLAAVGFSACEKKNDDPKVFASVAVIHASPGSPAVEVYRDTVRARFSVGTIGYLASSGYLGIEPGLRRLEVRTAVAPIATVLTRSGDQFNAGDIYSYFVYDTVTNGTVRSFRVKDDLTPPAGLTTKVRFFHLAPNAPAVDVTFLRTGVAPADSVTLTNRPYVGNAPQQSQLDSWANFTTMPSGNYQIRVKLAGTQTVVLAANTSFGANRVATVFASGTARGVALGAGVHRNF